MNKEESLIHQVSHNGLEFEKDNRTTWLIIKNLLVDTVAWSWIKSLDKKEDGKSAMKFLRTHYDGPGAVLTRIAAANQILKNIQYTNEQTFPFERYVTQ